MESFVKEFDPPIVIDATGKGFKVKHGLGVLHPVVFVYGVHGIEIKDMGLDYITWDAVMIYLATGTRVAKVVIG